MKIPISMTPVPSSWRRALFGRVDATAAIYLASPLFFFVLGVAILSRRGALVALDPTYGWTTYGCAVLLQTLPCFMADVRCFGHRSSWASLDVAYATATTLCGIPVITARWMLGVCAFHPLRVVGLWSVVAYAAHMKCRAHAACLKNDRLGFLRYHAAWHGFALLLVPLVP